MFPLLVYPSLPGVFVIVFTLPLVAAFSKIGLILKLWVFIIQEYWRKSQDPVPEPVGDLT